jgi:hypothetical protein
MISRRSSQQDGIVLSAGHSRRLPLWYDQQRVRRRQRAELRRSLASGGAGNPSVRAGPDLDSKVGTPVVVLRDGGIEASRQVEPPVTGEPEHSAQEDPDEQFEGDQRADPITGRSPIEPKASGFPGWTAIRQKAS